MTLVVPRYPVAVGVSVIPALFLAVQTFTVTEPMAMVVVGFLVMFASLWNTYKLAQVHTLVNSNFTEAKAARLIAEAALKTSQDLNVHLQQQLDMKVTAAGVSQASRRASDPPQP